MSPRGPAPAGAAQVKALNCPGCGASLTIRSFHNAVTIVCGSCHSILDAQDPRHQILQKFKVVTDDDRPQIPLGTRGKIRGTEYEAIGFQRRTIHVDGIPYSWHEYLLFNPYKGFRYLTEYNGHWNDVSTLKSLPVVHEGLGAPKVTYLGETYKHFQTAKAATSYVLGEFPWQVRVGETFTVSDYISPPRVLSQESSGQESTWSMGEYMSGKDVWKAFGLEGEPPRPVGVYENQPSPVRANVTALWLAFSIFLMALVAMMIGMSSLARDETVFSGSYAFNTNVPGETSFVSDEFELKGHPSDVEVTTTAEVDNNWIYLNYALINQDTGQAFDFGREVSYYHGYDSDGSWTEGSRQDSVAVPTVPPGQYYLRIEPESDVRRGLIPYSVTIRRDVPEYSFYGIAALALLIPAALISWRSMNFEHLRWAESDHAPAESGDD